MSKLIHLIYNSASTQELSDSELIELLRRARNKNAALNITGMLLYVNGCFFQILEGPEDAVDSLYASICVDTRHAKVTTIIREPIAQRAFTEWTMGFTCLTEEEVAGIEGFNDFFSSGHALIALDSGRAKKLLTAFKQGRWRVHLSRTELRQPQQQAIESLTAKDKKTPLTGVRPAFSFAFQPIINRQEQKILAYEALIRGQQGEPASTVLQNVSLADLPAFDDDVRRVAIALAARLGISPDLHLNFLPESRHTFPKTIENTLETARLLAIPASQIILELNHAASIFDAATLVDVLNDYRRLGMRICIDNFGHGYAGFAVLEHYQPEYISLSIELVRDVDSNGPRQAILRGLLQTCNDLGIDLIAKGVETPDEYDWLKEEGFNLFQGNLFAKPSFEALRKALIPAD